MFRLNGKNGIKFDLLFYAVARKVEGSLAPDQALVFRKAIFHERRHETHRHQTHSQDPGFHCVKTY
jgi:hypothetical protein